jgi:hypothetical protein
MECLKRLILEVISIQLSIASMPVKPWPNPMPPSNKMLVFQPFIVTTSFTPTKPDLNSWTMVLPQILIGKEIVVVMDSVGGNTAHALASLMMLAGIPIPS